MTGQARSSWRHELQQLWQGAEVALPDVVRAGQRVALRVSLVHAMETGRRKGAGGQIVPRAIIHTFSCDFNGINVISLRLEPGISPDPHLQFEVVIPQEATGEGRFDFVWDDDEGQRSRAQAFVTIA